MTTDQHAQHTHGYLSVQLGEALIRARQAKNLTRRQKALQDSKAPNTLREVELGLANPTLRRVEELAQEAGLDVRLTFLPRPKG